MVGSQVASQIERINADERAHAEAAQLAALDQLSDGVRADTEPARRLTQRDQPFGLVHGFDSNGANCA
jgi:hypothetical protein